MSMSDPIADMLTRIRNANTAKRSTVDVPSSRIKVAIADILTNEGYINGYDIIEDGVKKTMKITLKYGADKNEKVLNGLGIAIVSTNKGVITDKEARKLGIGGEVIAFVW